MNFIKHNTKPLLDGLLRGLLWWIVVDFSISIYAEDYNILFFVVVIICLALSMTSAIATYHKRSRIYVAALVSSLVLLLCILVDLGLRILHFHLFLFPVRLITSGESIFVFLGPLLFLILDFFLRLIIIVVSIVDKK